MGATSPRNNSLCLGTSGCVDAECSDFVSYYHRVPNAHPSSSSIVPHCLHHRGFPFPPLPFPYFSVKQDSVPGRPTPVDRHRQPMSRTAPHRAACHCPHRRTQSSERILFVVATNGQDANVSPGKLMRDLRRHPTMPDLRRWAAAGPFLPGFCLASQITYKPLPRPPAILEDFLQTSSVRAAAFFVNFFRQYY